jgi:hypothetical protein
MTKKKLEELFPKSILHNREPNNGDINIEYRQLTKEYLVLLDIGNIN